MTRTTRLTYRTTMLSSRTATSAALSLLLALCALAPATAFASDLTDVVDAADKDDPFDIHIEPRFKSTLKRAKITREAPCNPNVTEDPASATQPNNRLRFPRLVQAGRCQEPAIVPNKELRAWRQIYQVDLDLQIGLFRDVELHTTLPFIIQDQRGVHFAGNGGDPTKDIVDSTNSSVDPSDARILEDIQRNGQDFTTFRFFDAADGNEGPKRSGFGDMTVGLAWNPFNQERDDTKATLKLQFDYVIPSGEVAKPGNEGVGRGMHELQWSVASSKRFKYLEPYTSVTYTLPIAGQQSLFQETGPGQTLVQPGQRAEVLFGSEFIPYEDIDPEFKRFNRFVIDLGFKFGFVAEGRDYNLLSDAFAQSYCNGTTPDEVYDAIDRIANGANDASSIRTAGCRWIIEQPGNAQKTTPKYDVTPGNNGDIAFGHDGITDYESYATFGLQLGLYLQASEYFKLRTKLGLEHQQEHFLTSARTGKDSGDEDDTVRFDDPNERNPYYNPVLDSVGNRFRVEETTVFTWSVDMAFQF